MNSLDVDYGKEIGDRLPLVSVAIPVYNSARTLVQSIDSVLAQSYPHIEIIAVDDGSKDNSLEILRKYGDRVRTISQPNGGIAKARNVGCRAARGNFLALLDGDDLCEPERIAMQVAAMHRHPEAVVCGSDFSAFDANGPVSASHGADYYSVIGDSPRGLGSLYPSREILRLPATEGQQALEADLYIGDVYRQIAFGNFVHPPTVMLRRDALQSAGYFDERTRFHSDWECFVRLARLGPFLHIARPLLAYRLSPTQISSSRANDGRLAVELVDVSSKIFDADPELKATFSERIAQRYRLLCLDAASESAERRKGEAAGLLFEALKSGAFGIEALKVGAKIMLPSALVRLLREARGKGRA